MSQPQWIEVTPVNEHAEATRRQFAQAYGHEPSAVWGAPGRVNLIGEHLDYNGGPVLPIALPHLTAVAVGLAPVDHDEAASAEVRVSSAHGGQTVRFSLEALAPGSVAGWAAYVAGVIWAMSEAGWEVPAIDLYVDGRVPVGAGLSSSAALTCSTALAVAQVSQTPADWPWTSVDDDGARRALAAACIRAENEFAGAPTGGMDQSAAMRASAGHAMLLDCASFDIDQISWPAEAELLVVDTRSNHSLIDGQYGGRREACERAAELLGVDSLAAIALADLEATLTTLPDAELQGVVRHVITETDRVARVAAGLPSGDLTAAGEALFESHASMRDDFVISTPELDRVVEDAREAGALGARMTGGGFGGSAVVLCHPGTATMIGEHIHRGAEQMNHAIPGLMQVAPSRAAFRLGRHAFPANK